MQSKSSLKAMVAFSDSGVGSATGLADYVGRLFAFVHEFKYLLERIRFHGLAFTNKNDRVVMDSSLAFQFSDADCGNPSSGFSIGNHLAIAVFRAPEIDHAEIVALLPVARRFLPNVAMPIRNNVASS